jgi:serine/threonine protein phosphatase PrpC
MPLRQGAFTDTGRTRKNNQDRFLSMDGLAAVADGVGGHNAGEVASTIAIEELKRFRLSGSPASGAAVREALRAAFVRANQRIREASSRDEELKGMGTTLVAVLEDGDSIHLANVGDSRAYLLRDGELSQITVDHSLVQELVNEGRLLPEEAERHPHRSIITRALGLDTELQVDLFTCTLEPGDRLMLCSDGLSDAVGDASIRDLLLREPDPREAAARLVDAANDGGGPDNVTVIVLDTDDRVADRGPAAGGLDAASRVTGAGATGAGAGSAGGVDSAARGLSAAGARRPARRRPLRRALLAALVVVLLVGAVAGGRAFLFSLYWVGFDEQGQVAVYRGVPGDVAGLHFSQLWQRMPISRGQVPDLYAERLDDGVPARSLDDARRIANCAPVVFSGTSCSGASPASPTTVSVTTTAPPTTSG